MTASSTTRTRRRGADWSSSWAITRSSTTHRRAATRVRRGSSGSAGTTGTSASEAYGERDRSCLGINADMSTNQTPPRPVVHLELHTFDQVGASAFYAQLLPWRPQMVRGGAGSYLTFDTGGHLGSGVVECRTGRPL